MSYSEFLKIRKSPRYKVGDKVWFFDLVSGKVGSGTVEILPDEYSVFYGIRPLETPQDVWCIVNLLPGDIRKMRG